MGKDQQTRGNGRDSAKHDLSQDAFHLIQNDVDPPDEKKDVLWQQCRLVAVSISVVCGALSTVVKHILLSVLNGFFQCDGKREGDTGKLDG